MGQKEQIEKNKYYIMDPTGNITILVEGDVPADERGAVAAKLMESEPTAEQVGFVSYTPSHAECAGAEEETGAVGYTEREENIGTGHADAEGKTEAGHADITLRMAGGEFCGNATMSAAVLAVHLGKVKVPAKGEKSYNISVSASGAKGIRKVRVEANDNGSYTGTVDMPRPLSIKKERLPFEGAEYELTVVDFGGIAHVICEAGQFPFLLSNTKMPAERAVMEWCELLHAECLGLMIYDSEQGRLDPLVYVPNAGTLVWESSCASGTTALGAYLSEKDRRPVSLDISEPGGTLCITAEPEGKLMLTGNVRVIK